MIKPFFYNHSKYDNWWYTIAVSHTVGGEWVKYGYARVSTVNQKEDRQLDELIAHGIAKGHIFTDKQSGKDFERKQYIELCKTLKKGDLIVIKNLDRLGRN